MQSEEKFETSQLTKFQLQIFERETSALLFDPLPKKYMKPVKMLTFNARQIQSHVAAHSIN